MRFNLQVYTLQQRQVIKNYQEEGGGEVVVEQEEEEEMHLISWKRLDTKSTCMRFHLTEYILQPCSTVIKNTVAL